MTDLPDEDTIRVRRTWSRATEASPTERQTADAGTATEPADGPAIAGAVAGGTSPARRESDIVGPMRRRSTYIQGTEDLDPPTDDGSTIIARRETRRRAAREHAGDHHDGSWPAGLSRTPPPLPDRPAEVARGRSAAPPDVASGAVYSARPAEPVVASRSAPPSHPPQAPLDGDATEAARWHRRRRLALIVVTAASAVALVAAVSLILILFTQG
ncbi:MAG TPA: hypothetical protein VNP97_07030 [Microbacterium sp.]|nr:hypothetical protein [Microbacterium sp.]